MAQKLFSPDERKALEALATRRGFKTLRGYMQSLVQHDAEQHGETSAIEAADDLIDPVEGLKEGWADAMEGRTISREEFRRRMSENA
jgi:hypothetical protein